MSLISGAPKNLVYPLIQSLVHPMIVSRAKKSPLPTRSKPLLPSLRKVARPCFTDQQSNLMPFRREGLVKNEDGRSIQRMQVPENKSAEWLAKRYGNWVGRFMPGLISAKLADGKLSFWVLSKKLTLLELHHDPSRGSEDRVLFYIRGGLASRFNKKGRLEFRCIPGGQSALIAIHDFIPALPWFIYALVQAPFMRG